MAVHRDHHKEHRDRTDRGDPVISPNEEVIDPVCGMRIATPAQLTQVHAGRTFAFCSPHCRERFRSEPERYAERAKENKNALHELASVGVGEAWHGHRVVVEGNCLNEVDQVTTATVENKHVWFDNMVVRGKSGNSETVDAVEITGAATVLLDVQVADPDNPPEGTECIALVAHAFDTA